MPPHSLTAIVTIAALFLYLGFGVQVGLARKKAGLHAPRMTGDEMVERRLRIHANTLEWLPLLLVPMWLYAVYGSDGVAAGLGAVWIVGRVLYAVGYAADPARRAAGFLVQAVACLILMLGVLWKALYMLVALGA